MKNGNFFLEGVMRHTFLAGLVVFFVFAGLGFSADPEYRDGYLLVRFTETGFSASANTTRQAVLTAAGGGTIEKMYTLVPGLGLVKLPDGVSVPTAKAKFRASIGVKYAEPDYLGKYAAVPKDPSYNLLWGLHNTGQTGGKPDADIDAPEAWDINKGSAQIVVAVCDSGVDYDHEDLNANMWINLAEQSGLPGVDDDGNGYIDDIYGYDFFNGTGQIIDDVGHGTHVAGTIGAVGNNNIGVTGVNWNVRLMALKIGGTSGIPHSAAIEGIQYAIQNGARVMNHSWGGYYYDQALYDAIVASRDAGVVFVAAAGNEYNNNDTMPAYPASYDIENIISVLATEHNDRKAVFSNWGARTVDLGAPGQNILSTLPGNEYEFYNGTSMASPHVAGAAALVLANTPTLSYLEVKQLLISTVDKLPSLKEQCVSEGRLNLYTALLSANAGDKLAPTPDPMEWKVAPIAVGVNTFYMEAVTATDVSGVQYYFDCIGNDAFDSGWQTSPIYYRGGYLPLVAYQFRMQARDNSVSLNTTEWSEIAEVTSSETDEFVPYPSPAQWKSLPRKVSNTRIGMEAAQGYDEYGTAVNYFFECVSTTDPAYADTPELLSRGPQTNPVCFVDGVSVASPGNVYVYRVQIIDHLGNPTEWSDEAEVVLAPPPVTRSVPSATYPTIQRAIDASNHGDTVVVQPGVYREININFKGKRITVRSINPEDPSIVASTVIDCQEPEQLYRHETRRAFIFINGETRESALAGITIKNATAFDEATQPWNRGYSSNPLDWYNYDGTDAYGGAIYIGYKVPDPASPNPTYPDYLATHPASPAIHNCVFVNCSANGQYGQDGPNAPGVGNNTNGAPGARGGDGGNAYGGAIYAVEGSSPLIKKCRFYNCQAVGGNAGHGGNGSNGGGHSNDVEEANGWRGGDGGDAGRGGCAWGGAIYFEPNCVPELYDVTVSNSFVQVGEAGHGGNGANGSNAKGEGRGGHGGNGGVGGDLRAPDSSAGAIYFGANAQVVAEGCIFENCQVIAELKGRPIYNDNGELTGYDNYSGGNGGNGGDADGTGWPGGNGGQGGPAYFIPDKMLQIGGVDATGGTGGNAGNGAGGGARGWGGNGGFRMGLPGQGQPNGIDFDANGHSGIFPSNVYYMAYYWEDTANIVNLPKDPNDYLTFSNTWEWEPIEGPSEMLPYFPDPTEPEAEEYERTSLITINLYSGPFSPYYALISTTLYYDPTFNIVPVDPNDENSLLIVVPDYDNLVLVGIATELLESLIPTNPDEPTSGAIAGANYYGPNSVVSMKETVFSNNTSFANHGGAELYDKGCQATFEDCRYEGNNTLYETDVLTDYKFEGYGGAVFADQPVGMTFTGCDFVSNQAYAGGAVYCNFAPAPVVDTEDPNQPVLVDPRLELTDCTFTDNKADYHFMYSYGGAVYAGNALDPYEEYYFNFLKDHRFSSYDEYSDFYELNPSRGDEFVDFTIFVYDHYHGYAKFFYPIGTNLWTQDILQDDITITLETEAERILYGLNTPHYQVPVTKCSFEENLAPYGAGLYVDASISSVINSSFLGNIGQTGSGTYSYVCDLFVQDNLFDKNSGSGVPTLGYLSQQDSSTIQTYGSGAAQYISNCDLFMINNRFTDNTVNGYAGAVYIIGPSIAGYSQTLVNNLFIENKADMAGGALIATGHSDVDMSNCSFVDNAVSDLISGVAGAVLVHDTFMSVRNSIFWDNVGVLGSQITVGDPLEVVQSYDPSYIPVSTLWIYNSDTQGGQDDIYIDYNGWPWLIYENTNIEDDPSTPAINEADPLFAYVSDPNEAADRTLYLSQIEAGQLETSPCVDTGIGSVADMSALLGFTITTRTDHIADTEPLNMGFYYNAALPVVEYPFTASVYATNVYPRGKLMVSCQGNTPVEVGVEPYITTIQQGVQVLLTAVPETNYRVKRWVGTDNDASVGTVNRVTMGGSRTVQVEFELAVPKRLFVPEAYTSIEDAVEAARSGDTIVLALRAGQPYTITNPEGINFGGKQLTLTSTNPLDPYVVANTVIDCQGTRYIAKRAFQFNNGEDPNTVIEGITIRNGFWAGAIGASAAIPGTPYPPLEDRETPNRANSGMDATGNGYGGAILCTDGSSPTIRYVVFENCTVAGGIGGDGADGYTQNPEGMTGNIDGQSGGHGGDGFGNGFGGAIAVVDRSSPIITLCTFKNNRATGGWGGIPGNGGHAVGNGYYSWGGDAGDGEGDGRGGAIYIEKGCNPLVTSNIFKGNYSRLGYVSAGGRGGNGNPYPAPWDAENWPIAARAGRNGMLYSFGTVAGGAVFYGEKANSYIADSVFENNQAYLPLPMNISLTYYTIPADVYDYTRGGAIFADPNVTLSIENCQFIENLGGAIYASSGSNLTVDGSHFEDNATYDPALGKSGIYNLEAYFIAGLEEEEVSEQPAGAITVEASTVTTSITDCKFGGNLSDGSGGAIHTKTNLTIANTSFTGNDAVLRGGALFAYRYIEGPDIYTLKVDMQNCDFAYNGSDELGGAVYAKNNVIDVQNCQFVGNKAPSGGALLAVESELEMANGLFVANEATGLAPTFEMITDSLTSIMFSIVIGNPDTNATYQTILDEGIGGGLYLVDTSSAIVDTRILNNTAKGANSFAGGLCINGGQGILTHNLQNCLIAGNSTEGNGGGIALRMYADPRFDNCTIADNVADKLGGGMYVDWSSKAVIFNSIVSGNSPTDIEQQTSGSVTASSVFYGNPMFVQGPLGNYYLNPLSSAVNSGNTTAAAVGLNTFTTNPAIPVVLDSGIVDLGYHYEDPGTIPQYTLSVVVQDNRGTVTPFGGLYYYGQIVDLTAAVNTDYVITGWSGGTVNDGSSDATNQVIITGNKDITVKVRQRQTYYVGGSTGFPEIQNAVDAAQDGDLIVINPGIYRPGVGTSGDYYSGLVTVSLNGKTVRISGANPDDENIVRNTVFEDYEFSLVNASSDSVIEGITIRSGQMGIFGGAPTIRNVIFSECRWSGGEPEKSLNCSNSVVDGADGGSVLGGAVMILEGAPKFQNCKFEDNWVRGGVGQNGADGCDQHPEGGEGGWPGRAYGGAVYAAFSSKPIFESCVFTGNQALGGTGGNGGTGARIQGVWYHGGRGGGFLWPDSIENDVQNYWSWFDGWEEGDKYWYYSLYYGRYDYATWAKWFGWTKWNSWAEFFASTDYQNASTTTPKVDGYEEYWKYSGFGGAVYVAYMSEASFVNCTFENNETQGSLCGVGGGDLPTPNRQLNLPNAGGAVYAAYDSKLSFESCRFADNLANTSTVELPHLYEVSFGGAVAYEFGCEAKFNNTNIQWNQSTVGGGIYGNESITEIVDCNALDNEAYIGGGLYLENGSASITNTLIQANNAKAPTVTITPPDDDDQNDDDPIVLPETVEVIGEGAGLFAASVDLNLSHSVFVRNNADISGGALLLTGTVPNPSTIFNNLFIYNKAGRDGAGASVNWESRATFGNCTFANNDVTGYGEVSYNPGTGGGLYCAYNSVVDVINSIFWANQAAQGAQITVGTGFEFDPRPSTLNIAYTDIQSYGSTGALFRGQGCTVNPVAGMLGTDPLFDTLPDTEETDVRYQYYLKRTSPLIDAGSTSASALGLSDYTTSILGGRDRGEVDLGYHYSIVIKSSCSLADLVLSGRIDLADFAEIASGWLLSPCGNANNWCNGADLNFDRIVDAGDLFSFTACWLVEDTEPPFPSPSLWAMEPNAVTGTFTRLIMEIGETHDAWWPDTDLTYYFECLNDTTRSSGWIATPVYQLTNLLPGYGYTFTVRARDGIGNETLPSIEVTEKPGENVKPVAAWNQERLPYSNTSTSVQMEAAMAYSGSLPSGVWVEYRFEYVGNLPGGTSSDWQASPIYVDTDLTTGLTYEYRVRARFNTNYGPFEPSEPSDIAAVLVVPVDLDPPTPNPAEFTASSPFQQQLGNAFYHIMVATEAADANPPVSYRFICIENSSFSSGWRNINNVTGTYPNGTTQVPQQYWVEVGVKNLLYNWRVQYRDALGNVGELSPAKQITNVLP